MRSIYTKILLLSFLKLFVVNLAVPYGYGGEAQKVITHYSGDSIAADAFKALKKGIKYFHSISIRGGYVFHYTLDLKEKWGEGKTDDSTIEVQPPGTPAVGVSFLRAFKVTGEIDFLKAAEDAGDALILGQNELGGWEHKIYFNREISKTVSFDDNQTQGAIRFLMALDQEIQKKSLRQAVDRALKMMLKSQFENGAWPHKYPKQGNYHDFATFNDGGINDCIDVMIDAHRYYGKNEYLESINKAGWFLILSQLPPPQPGWVQQYNEYLQPAWARSFEPPAVCPIVTLRNINSLIDLYLYTGSRKYLEPIPDSIQWVKETRLPNGNWPRFVELGTNRPLYYDRGRVRVPSMQDLHIERRTGYGYEQDLSKHLEETMRRFDEVSVLGKKKFLKKKNQPLSRNEKIEKLKSLEPVVRKIISAQDELGRWITKNDRFRKVIPGKSWNGEYIVKDRISSGTFNKNVNTVCDYIELQKSLK